MESLVLKPFEYLIYIALKSRTDKCFSYGGSQIRLSQFPLGTEGVLLLSGSLCPKLEGVHENPSKDTTIFFVILTPKKPTKSNFTISLFSILFGVKTHTE